MALSAARRPAGRRRGPLLLPSLLLSVPGACLLAAYFGPAFFAPAGKPQRPAVQRRLHNHRAAAVGVRSAIGEAPTQEEAVAVVPDGEEEASQAAEEAVGAGADGGEEAGKKEEGRMLMVQDLQIGQELQGVVTKIIKMGAFVDVKAERPGLVPRNKLRSNFTANVADVVKVGDKVKVWVSEANGEKFILSMVKGKAYAPSTAKRAPINLLEPLAGAEDTWLDGTVARIQPWGAFVSVVPPGAEEGEQVQGLVHRKEIKAGGFKGSVEEEFAIGQAVRVRVLSVDTGASRAAFSMVDAADAGGAEEEEEQRQAEEDLYTADLGQFHDIAGLTDEWLTGRVVSASPIGVFVAVKGPDGGEDEARGFLHRSQIRDAFVEDASQEFEMGEEVKVRVAKVQLDQHKMFLTMLDKPAAPTKKKEPPSPQDAQRFAELVGGDQWLVGKVTAVTKFGAFVEVEHPSGEGKPVTGLVHLTEMSDAFVENIQDIVDVGQEARVRLIACDTASGKVSLSMKEPSSEKERPVADVAAFRDLPSDLWLTGTVTRLDNFGIFVEVPAPSGAADGGPPGVGLVHISQVADRFVEDVAEIAEVGQEVQVRVLEVDVDKGRLAFSMLDPEARKADEAEAEEESQQEEGTES